MSVFTLVESAPLRARCTIVLAYGFRPFFLATAGWAIVALALWMLALAGLTPSWLAIDLAWHQHEMIFGVFGAAIAGFLLTAIPEWTKASPLTGWPLALLFGLWIAGRAVMILGIDGIAPALLVVAFLPCVTAIGARSLIVHRPPRLGLFVSLIGLLGVLEGLWQAGRIGLVEFGSNSLALPSLAILAALITLASGRVAMVVSQLALLADQSTRRLRAEPASTDLAAWLLLLLAGVLLFGIRPPIVGWIAFAAAAAQIHRLCEWWIGLAMRRAYVWPLHAGSLMIAAACAAVGFDRLGSPLPSSGIAHTFGIGAAALVTLVVMTIAGLRHTGHDLVVPRLATAALTCVAAATLLRAVPAFDAISLHIMLGLSAVLWIAAFALYLASVGPKLLRARVDGKPG